MEAGRYISPGEGLSPPARWELRAPRPEAEARLTRECGLPSLMARVLAARGFDAAAEVEEFLRPRLAGAHDPMGLRDMDRAVERIRTAMERGEEIWIYGDYDVDGVTATAILLQTFEFLRRPARAYIPHRLTEGYGLRPGAVRHIAANGGRLVVTVDNGTTAVEEIALAAELGIDVIVTDHHESNGEPPAAFALVNPKRLDCAYPFKDLSGAGVAFKLAHALLKRSAPDPAEARAFLRTLLDLVALGTLADVVPLRGENRCFVAHGVEVLRDGRRPGLKSLLEVIGGGKEPSEAGNLAFTVAPRINAAGRTEHAEYALELLMTRDRARAAELARMLDRFNEDRRRIETEITLEALEMAEARAGDRVIVVGREGWHLGVVGIVASRILERHHRPVIVLGVEDGVAKGSARSIRGFDIHAALSACADHLTQFGGHAMAAGLRLPAAGVENFRRAINGHAGTALSDEDLIPVIKIDAKASHDELTPEAAAAMEAMAPHGMKNPKPLIEVEGLSLLEAPSILKSRHLKMHLGAPDGRSLWAMGFGMAGRAGELQFGPGRIGVAATPVLNRWGGRVKLELLLKDFRSA